VSFLKHVNLAGSVSKYSTTSYNYSPPSGRQIANVNKHRIELTDLRLRSSLPIKNSGPIEIIDEDKNTFGDKSLE
jgi:hypothetical protein